MHNVSGVIEYFSNRFFWNRGAWRRNYVALLEAYTDACLEVCILHRSIETYTLCDRKIGSRLRWRKKKTGRLFAHHRAQTWYKENTSQFVFWKSCVECVPHPKESHQPLPSWIQAEVRRHIPKRDACLYSLCFPGFCISEVTVSTVWRLCRHSVTWER